jgi:hypothetical protein
MSFSYRAIAPDLSWETGQRFAHLWKRELQVAADALFYTATTIASLCIS